MTGFFQSIITIVLFILMLGILVDDPRAGPLLRGPPGEGPRPRVRRRVPARAKVIRSKGETVYTLNWLPIGGFVKLEGEDGTDADDPRSFAAPAVHHEAAHPRGRRRDERRSWPSSSSPGSRSTPIRPSGSRWARSRKARRPLRPASSSTTPSCRSTARPTPVRWGAADRRPAGARRRDDHPRHQVTRWDSRAGAGGPATRQRDRRDAQGISAWTTSRVDFCRSGPYDLRPARSGSGSTGRSMRSA